MFRFQSLNKQMRKKHILVSIQIGNIHISQYFNHKHALGQRVIHVISMAKNIYIKIKSWIKQIFFFVIHKYGKYYNNTVIFNGVLI